MITTLLTHGIETSIGSTATILMAKDQETADAIPSKMSIRPVSVLFICLGNICRSPMAEAVFRYLTASHSHVGHIDSAGTGAYHEGDSPDPRTMSTIEDHGILDYVHAARKVQASDLSAFDYILAMDKENLHDLQRLKGRILAKGGSSGPTSEELSMGKIQLFGDFGGKRGEAVGDPYYGTSDGFDIAYEQMVRFSRGFITEVLDRKQGD